MSDSSYPVSVAVRRPDGSVEHVRVGTAVRSGDGFVLKLGELLLGEAAPAAQAPRGPVQSFAPAAGGSVPNVFPNYGRSKGAPIAGASASDLEYYANGARRSLADSTKARFHEKERALLAAIEAEQARQSGSPTAADEPPPHSDDDMPPVEMD